MALFSMIPYRCSDRRTAFDFNWFGQILVLRGKYKVHIGQAQQFSFLSAGVSLCTLRGKQRPFCISRDRIDPSTDRRSIVLIAIIIGWTGPLARRDRSKL